MELKQGGGGQHRAKDVLVIEHAPPVAHDQGFRIVGQVDGQMRRDHDQRQTGNGQRHPHLTQGVQHLGGGQQGGQGQRGQRGHDRQHQPPRPDPRHRRPAQGEARPQKQPHQRHGQGIGQSLGRFQPDQRGKGADHRPKIDDLAQSAALARIGKAFNRDPRLKPHIHIQQQHRQYRPCHEPGHQLGHPPVRRIVKPPRMARRGGGIGDDHDHCSTP